MKTTTNVLISRTMNTSTIYNNMGRATKTNVFEAKRTLEAISIVKSVPYLTRRLRNV